MCQKKSHMDENPFMFVSAYQQIAQKIQSNVNLLPLASGDSLNDSNMRLLAERFELLCGLEDVVSSTLNIDTYRNNLASSRKS